MKQPARSAGVPPAKSINEHKGWYSRGYLPHCDSPELIQSITFRLADALPKEMLSRIEQMQASDDDKRPSLDAWLDHGVMPNHVHVLVETFAGWPMDGIVHSWKSITAKAINRTLGRSSSLWQGDYFDRFIRDDAHLHAVRDYIRNNPVEAGLCGAPEEWPFSSACANAKAASGTLALPSILPAK